MTETHFIILQSINLALAAGIPIFVALYMFGKYIFTWPQLDARIQGVRHYRTVSTAILEENLNYEFWRGKKKAAKKKKGFKERVLDVILKNPFLQEENMKLSFEQAGWHLKETLTLFVSFKLLCFLIGLSIGYIFILYNPSFAQAAFLTKWVLLLLTAFSGWLVPDLFLKLSIKNRVALIEKQFPDALDLVIICLQAGLSLNRAIERVSKEMIHFGKEIAHEFSLTTIELEIILDRRQALQHLYMRVPSTIIRTFATTILQSIQQGTPTQQALDVLSQEIRDTRMQTAETKAAKLPSLLVVPLVLFILPNLFILLLGPAIVKLVQMT